MDKDAAAIEQALLELLNGPCRERREENSVQLNPVLLVIDDFERALLRDKPFPHPVHPDFSEAISATIRAFKRADARSYS